MLLAKVRYSARCRQNLHDCASVNASWRSLKTLVFGAESDVLPLCSHGGAVVSDPASKAELLSAWFDSKQSRDIVEWPLTGHPWPSFREFAFRVREVMQHLMDLDLNGGVDWSGYFPMFFFRRRLLVLPLNIIKFFADLLSGGLLMSLKFPKVPYQR